MVYNPASVTVNSGVPFTFSITKSSPDVNTKILLYPCGMLLLPSAIALIMTLSPVKVTMLEVACKVPASAVQSSTPNVKKTVLVSQCKNPKSILNKEAVNLYLPLPKFQGLFPPGKV